MSPPADPGTIGYAPGMSYHMSGRLYFACHETDGFTIDQIERNPNFFFFSSGVPEEYVPFCADFGPSDIVDVLRFCREIRDTLNDPRLEGRRVVFYTQAEAIVVTNSTFLICCYLMLEENHTPEQAIGRFERIRGLPIRPYRDAAFHEPTFALSILSCLRGLQRAISLGWITPATFDVEAYESLVGQPTHDMTKVSPKFVMMATPTNSPNGVFQPVPRRPADYIPRLRGLGVTNVVRLIGGGLYDDKEFTDAGFNHHPLETPDHTGEMPLEAVRRFLDIADSAGEGVVAVHCKTGLGRTGTLVACYMVKNQGFTAAEAIGYLRLMRPGSVIGQQQNFLERIELGDWAGNMPVLAPL